jgi:L-alanine-DL-glutamate epimerase-like enolase superfamily enzyme
MSIDALEDAEEAFMALAARVPLEVTDRDTAFAIARTVAARAPAARFAIETALLDALARDRGVPLAALLRSSAATEIALAAVVDDPASARRAVAAGIRCLKIKVDAADDLRRVFAIAGAAPQARLRIDANRSWPRGEVGARLAAFAQLPIDYVEEPCADAHRLAAERLPCRIALDESLATIAPDALRAALRGPALAALVLKPTLLGGFSAALELAELARHAGVAAIVSHALEGPAGTAACAELALALGGDHPVGLAAHPALAAWQLAVSQLAPDRVRPAAAPGLGFADLDLAGLVRACFGAR